MKYRAVINFDFQTRDNNRYNELIAALEDIGWQKVGTSALTILTSEIEAVLYAMNLFQKQCLEIGNLTALTFNCQEVTPKVAAASEKHKWAQEKIEMLPDPMPKKYHWKYAKCRARVQAAEAEESNS